MSDERYPLGEPAQREPAPEPDWMRKVKAHNPGAGLPAGVSQQADGKWQTAGHKAPAASYCPHLHTMMNVCTTCGTVVGP